MRNNRNIATYGEHKIQAYTYIKLSDGTIIESDRYATSMRDVVELAVGHAEDLTADQLAAVEAMIAANPYMKNWDTENLYAPPFG